jgi:hypothetical protein
MGRWAKQAGTDGTGSADDCSDTPIKTLDRHRSPGSSTRSNEIGWCNRRDYTTRPIYVSLPKADHRISNQRWSATIYGLPLVARDGALIAYGPDQMEMYHAAGQYLARVVKGEKPSDLPVQQPTHFQLAINLATAKALGIKVPATLIARADEVIE